ncbi:MAG: glycoside hydrolase family 16 protein [Oscillospiraceae bacterium]|nr:glycoside hydrolase family 16 protein [Oscillospiraceae bacterium]
MQAFLDWYFAPRQIRALNELGPLFRELFSLGGLKRAGVILIVIVEIFCVLIFDSARTPRGPELDLTGYSVVLEDNFDGDTLNLDVWAYRGTGQGTGRGGYMHPSQVRVEDGNLIVKAEYLEDGAFGAGWYSGMIRIKEEFVYGYFEITCIMSKGGGFSSAWWLNSQGMTSSELSRGGVGGSEVDIAEAYNYDKLFRKNSVGLNVHVDGYGADLKSQQLGNWKGNNIYEEYNTYGVMWTDTEYIFYINGVEAARTAFKDGVSEAPEYAIISLGMPTAEELSKNKQDFSTEFIIDSVRIMQKD